MPRFNLFTATVRRSAMAALTGLVLLLPIRVTAQERNSVLIHNASGITIRELYISSSSDHWWHRDLLNHYVLPSAYETTVSVAPGTYDLKLVDKDGDSCVLQGVRIVRNSRFDITPERLVGCEFLTALN